MEKIAARIKRRMPIAKEESFKMTKPLESKLKMFSESFKRTPFNIKEQIIHE
jgi:hypothetical protein